MEALQLFLFSLLISTGFAWPRQRQSSLTMEGALARGLGSSGVISSHTYRPAQYRNRVFAQQEEIGLVDVCKSVKAKRVGASENTAIHFCKEGSGVCYFTALMRCCNTQQSNLFSVGGDSTVQLGSKSFQVNFNLIGGFGDPAPAEVCFLILDDTIDVCESSLSCEEGDCAPGTEVCLGNVEPDTICDVDTGCTCKRGYLAPNCCDCAPDFVKNEEGVCEEICLRNCLRGSELGCMQCFPGFQLQGVGCCQCAGDLVGENCDQCPAGQLRGSNNRCFICPEGQVLDSSDQCVCPEGQLEGSDGRCISCLPGQVLNSFNQCLCATGQLRGSQNQCISCPAGQILNNLDQCVCPEGQLEGSNDRCITCRSDQTRLNQFDQCVCPPGRIEFSGECVDPCEENCAPNMFDQTFGCSTCKAGYRTRPLCCDCTSDRIRSGTECVCPSNRVINPTTGVCETCPGDKVPVNGVCQCPEGTIEQGDTCFDCPAPRVVRDGSCQCPEGQEEGPNGDCIIPPQCGENQDVIFLQDITQSFSIPNFRRIMHALQFIVGALKTNEVNNVNVAVVLYPYIFILKDFPDRSASLNISLAASCETAVQSLEELSYSIFFGDYQSEETRSYGAMEYVEDNMINDMNQPTTVMTLTDGPSDVSDQTSRSSSQFPINRINAAIRGIQLRRPNTRFYAAGVEIGESVSDDALFDEELKALGENIDSHYVRTDSDITAFTNSVINLLVDASVLCPNQRTAIMNGIQTSSLADYGNCIQSNQFRRVRMNYGPCYPSNICSLSIPPPAKAASGSNLERRILEAVEQVLYERNFAKRN